MELAIAETLGERWNDRSYRRVVSQRIITSLAWAILDSVGLLTVLRLVGIATHIDPVAAIRDPLTLQTIEGMVTTGIFVLVFFIAHYSKFRSLPLDVMTTTRQLMMTITNGFVIVDEAGIVEGANTVVEDIFGYKRQELIGKDISVILPEFRATLKQGFLSRRLETGGHQVIGLWPRETVGLRQSREAISLELVVSEVRGWNKRLYALGLRDTSDRRQLERRANLMQEVSDEAAWPLAVYEGDRLENLRYLYVNPAYAAVLGLDPDEMISSMDVATIKGTGYVPQVDAATVAAIGDSLLNRRGLTTRLKHVGPDGSDKYFDLKICPIDIPGDPRVLWLARSDDASERISRARDLQLQSAALEQMDDAIYMFDDSGKLLDCNRSGEALAGRTRQELMGSVGFAFLNTKTNFVGLDPSSAPGLERSATRHEVTAIRATGGEIYLEVTVSPVFDDSGHLMSTVAVCRDKTKERAEARRIKLSEERLNRAQAQAQMGSWEFVGSPSESICSEELFRMGGLEPRPTTSAGDWYCHIHPDDLATITDWYKRGLNAEEPGPCTFRFIRPDGSIRLFVSEMSLERETESGEVRGYGVTRDITDELARTEFLRTLELALDGSPNAVLITKGTMNDREDHIIYVNKAFERIMGFGRDEIVGRSTCEVLPWCQENPDLYQNLRETVLNDKALQIELAYQRHDLKTIDVEVSVARLKGPDGLADHSIATIVDITDRKLAEEQNAQAEKMRALGQLTSGVAHDFNNFLAIIRANIEMLQIRLGTDQRRVFADRAIRGCDKAVNLTTSLLAFARKQPLDPALVNVNDVVESVNSQAMEILGPRIRLSTRYEFAELIVVIDAVHLESSILNLLINSRDAMPHGGRIALEVSVEKEIPTGAVGTTRKSGDEYVCITVIDTGTGMPEHVRQRALEPFFTTKPAGKGTGLGLSDVFGFIQQSNGAIYIKSEERLGTEISLYIPRVTTTRAAA